jgi:trans-aconitate methyltransferase
MAQESTDPMYTNQWDPTLYNQKHSFVFEYGKSLISLLNPQPGERILDLGCGTGHLTKSIAESGAHVVGIDSSKSMIEAAQAQYTDLEFLQADARSFSFPFTFDAIFSNAVLHWILEPECVVQCISRPLKPGGRFVAEFGGNGNVANIATALRDALREYGHGDESTWWYNPTVSEYAMLLEEHGFEVRLATLYDRLTQLEDGENGLRKWIEMFRGGVIGSVNRGIREEVLKTVEKKLRGVLFKEGSWYADYRRLRILAFKV